MLKRNKKPKDKPDISLPPQVPDTAAELERAIALLGNRVQKELNPKARQELLDLLNAYPDVSTAAVWKQKLRQVSKELKSSMKSSIAQVAAPPISATFLTDAKLNPETQVMLSWANRALQEHYLDDEQRYDPQFVEQVKSWLNSPDGVNPIAYLAQRLLEATLALTREEDPLDFDLSNFDFDLERQPIISQNQPSFLEPLLRLALQKVQFHILGEFILKQLSLTPESPQTTGTKFNSMSTVCNKTLLLP